MSAVSLPSLKEKPKEQQPTRVEAAEASTRALAVVNEGHGWVAGGPCFSR